MAPTFPRPAVLALALIAARPAPAQSPALGPETPGLRATQVAIVLEKGGKAGRFRGTVMARKGEVLTVLTAAHCLALAEEGGPVRLVLDGGTIAGTVVSLVRNPAFKSNPGREIPGPDNAVARFRFRPAEAGKAAAGAFEAIEPATALASRTYPGPSGQVISIRLLDQHGVEHALKAGNYSNPRYLEWGPAYKPVPGDSGGGVFVLNPGPDGQPRPVLIGLIVCSDEKGGAASLVSREMKWIADELAR